MKSVVAFSILLLHAAALQAQGVYVTPGANGPVFSDKMQPGAREVRLPPLNVVAPPPAATPAAKESETDSARDSAKDSAKPEVPAYRSLAIVQPENYGSMVANTALFEVRVAVDPPLQQGAGHAFAVSIDGRAVDARFTATEFIIPPEFWGDELPTSAQSHQLDVGIVDRAGRVLNQAAPVRFFMRQAPWVNAPRPPPHPLRPLRPPTPAVPAVPAVGAAIR